MSRQLRKMYAVSDDVQKHAGRTVDTLKKYFHLAGNEAYDTAAKLSKRVQSAYPQVAQNVTDIAVARAAKLRRMADQGASRLGDLASHHAAHLKDSISGFGHDARIATRHFGESTRRAGVYAFRLGALYALIRIYATRNREMAEMTRKVKNHIESKPVQSSLIALGIGYALAKLLR